MGEQQRMNRSAADLHEYIGASIPQTISEHYLGCDLLDRIDAALAGTPQSATRCRLDRGHYHPERAGLP